MQSDYQQGKYYNMSGRVTAWINGENGESLEDLLDALYIAYHDGKLDSTGYDHLVSLLQDYE